MANTEYETKNNEIMSDTNADTQYTIHQQYFVGLYGLSSTD